MAHRAWLGRGHNARHFELDLLDAEATFRVAEQCLAELGPPNVLIHVAGVVERALIHQMTPSVWQSQMEINLHAPFRLTHAFLGEMRRSGRGRILFVSSISAVLGSAGQAAYNASKAGVLGLMRCLAEEIKDTGLMTAAVLPGAVDTDMLKGSGYQARMSASEVAGTLLFLGIDASPAHNGACIEMFGV